MKLIKTTSQSDLKSSFRLTCYYGDFAYKYSGRLLQPIPWKEAPQIILNMKKLVEKEFNIEVNSVLLNRYRDGKDSNGWHSDNESVYGDKPNIVSCSFGETRDFLVKPKKGTDKKVEGSSGIFKNQNPNYRIYCVQCHLGIVEKLLNPLKDQCLIP